MWSAMKEGWFTTMRQPFAVITLFIYQLVWGLFLYRIIQGIVVPLMHRYPGSLLPRETMQLFMAESQFRLMKTDLTHSYLWLLLVLLLLRMALHSLLNAGIYYSLAHPEMNSGYRFVRGIRALGLSFFGYYLLQIALLLSPLYFLLPQLYRIYTKSESNSALLAGISPYLGGYLLYGALLYLVFLYLQLGKAMGKKPLFSLLFLLRYSLPIMLLGLVTLSITGALTLLVVSASLIWAGLAALILFQAYRFADMFGKIWVIASQIRYWTQRIDS